MTKVLLNFANNRFHKSQQKNSETGMKIGGFDTVFSYTPKDIDRAFFKKHESVLTRVKGAGYWLWKPYFILKTLEKLQNGDFLFYCDAGAHFVSSIDPLIATCESAGQDIIPFDVGFIEKHYTKRDAFMLMNCDFPEYTDSSQRLASFILFKKSALTIDFCREYLAYACDKRILTDCENEMGLPNDTGFIAHRHDQSIFSLLSKKYQLIAHRDPSQWGNGGDPDKYPQSQYGQLIEHTRKRNISLSLIIREHIQNLISRKAAKTQRF